MTILGQLRDNTEPRIRKTWAYPSWWLLLVVLPWTIGALICVHEWLVDKSVASREQTTQGIITVHEPSNHNRYEYVFSMNGKSFTGWESPRTDRLEIGQQVVVYYDPLNPSKNAPTEFGELGMENLGPLPLLLFGIGAVAWYIKTRRRTLKLPPSY